MLAVFGDQRRHRVGLPLAEHVSHALDLRLATQGVLGGVVAAAQDRPRLYEREGRGGDTQDAALLLQPTRHTFDSLQRLRLVEVSCRRAAEADLERAYTL